MRRLIQFPLFETPGNVAGGGGGGGPASGSAPSSGVSGGSGGGDVPSHVDLTADSYVRVPGSDKPVKYSDFIGGYVSKADFTRAQQRAAAEAGKLQQSLKEQETRFQEAARQILGRLGGQPGQGQAPNPNDFNTVLQQLETREYVDGRTAAGLVRQILQGSVMPLAQAIQQRDAALQLMFKRLQALDGSVGSLRDAKTTGDFQTKLATVRQSQGLPDHPVINELLQDVFLSHEGQDLDQEFPNLVKSRIDQLRTLFRAEDKREADEARQKRLGIPGKGGQAATGRPLKRGFQTPQQLADDLWPGFGGPET